MRTRLELMQELRDSIERSRCALIALDLGAIEQGTREQTLLSLQLAGVIRRMQGGVPASVSTRETKTENSGHNLFALSCQLRMVEREVMQALRVQLALLDRAQYKLRVLGNALAGSNIDYGAAIAGQTTAPELMGKKIPGPSLVRSGSSQARWEMSWRRARGA